MEVEKTHEWNVRKFCFFFQDKIRVRLAWPRFVAEKWPIRIYSLYQPEDLAFALPWYTAHGQEVLYSNPLATPLNLTDISDWLAQLRGERQRVIDQFYQEYVSSGQPASLVIPTYRLNSEQLGHRSSLLLDSNHHLTGLYLANVPFKITVVEICGPLDAVALPDLRHYVPEIA